MSIDGGTCAGVELLAVRGASDPFTELARTVAAAGGRVDVARDLSGARRAFLRRGGHRWLLLAADVAPRLAAAVVASLRSIDPALGVVVFGAELLREQRGLRRLTAYHPGSRAGVGALLRLVHAET